MAQKELKNQDWSIFDKFEELMEEAVERYLPEEGQGETMASQITTCINKLIYHWLNDGDVYDNTHFQGTGCNNISCYANWLYSYIPQTREILDKIYSCSVENEYLDILFELAKFLNNEKLLEFLESQKVMGDIYSCEEADFVFEEEEEE